MAIAALGRSGGGDLALDDRSRDPDLPVLCSDCGALLDLDGARVYRFGEQGFLCWSCATRRGGSYDAERDVWTAPPSLADLEREE